MNEEKKFGRISIYSKIGDTLQFGEKKYKGGKNEEKKLVEEKQKFQKLANAKINNLRKSKQAIMALNEKLEIDGKTIKDKESNTNKYKTDLMLHDISIINKKDDLYVVYCNNKSYEFKLKDGKIENYREKEEFNVRKITDKLEKECLHEGLDINDMDEYEEKLNLIKHSAFQKKVNFEISRVLLRTLKSYDRQGMSEMIEVLKDNMTKEFDKEIDIVVTGQSNEYSKDVQSLIKEQELKERGLKQIGRILPKIKNLEYVSGIYTDGGSNVYVEYQNGKVYEVTRRLPVELKEVSKKNVESIEKSPTRSLVNVGYDLESKNISLDNMTKKIEHINSFKRKLVELIDIQRCNDKQLKNLKDISKKTQLQIKQKQDKINNLDESSKLKIVKYVFKNTLRLKNIKGVWKAPKENMIKERRNFLREKNALEAFEKDLNDCIGNITFKQKLLTATENLVKSTLKSKKIEDYNKLEATFDLTQISAADGRENVLDLSKKYNEKVEEASAEVVLSKETYSKIQNAINGGIIEEYKLKGSISMDSINTIKDTLEQAHSIVSSISEETLVNSDEELKEDISEVEPKGKKMINRSRESLNEVKEIINNAEEFVRSSQETLDIKDNTEKEVNKKSKNVERSKDGQGKGITI